MSVRRFVGANSRDVMRQVREILGDDALILANRRTEGGVEILAMADEAVDQFDPAPAADVDSAFAPEPVDSAPSFSMPSSSPDPLQSMSERLLQEMQDMRALLTRQQPTAPPSAASPGDMASELQALLLGVGFGEALSDELIAELPDELLAPGVNRERAMAWLREQLMARLSVLEEENAFFDQTGIVALVGPTGVGKTTTTAKLAARFVMRHGTRPVALVTTDSFRIGAHEQLRIYARLLDTPMYALDAEQPIDELVGRLQGKQWVMVDTVGMSQRDQRVIEQIAHLQGGQTRVRLVLLLNAASQPETLEEVVLRYRQAAQAAGAELDDCIISKQDEAGRLAPVLDIVMRHGMRVLFSSYGQQVPEDMAVASPSGLIEQAMSAQAAPHRRASSAPLQLPRWSQDVLGQGRRLGTLLTRLRQRVTGFAELEAVWDVAGLPGALHDDRLDQLLAEPRSNVSGSVWFARRNERGCDWAMPDLMLDESGALGALASLQHRQPAGWLSRLTERQRITTPTASIHLLPVLPDSEALGFLEAQQMTWVSQVSPQQRVYYQRERSALRELFADSALTHRVALRFRGQAMQLWTVYAEVTDADGTALLAWYGEVRDPESAKRVARRYWLTPARLGTDLIALLMTQLQSEGTAALTKRAWQQLKDADGGDVSSEVRLLMASGAAAVAGHLDCAGDDDAQLLHQDLMRLLATQRKRRDTALLDAVVHLLMARDAVRQMGSASREAFV